jgi:Tfp pilus assembly protein PilP
MTRMTSLVLVGSLTAAAAAAGQGPVPAPAPVEAAAPAATPSPGDRSGGPSGPPAPPQGYTYRAEGRRDPFVTLVKRGSDASSATAAGRAAGLAGLSAGEVSLRGTLASQGGYVAMLLGSDDKTYIVRPGDKLADGTIRTITASELVILQQVKDPLAVQRQREVRKLLRQSFDEAVQ